MKKEYTIPTMKIELFQKRITKMSNKAKKLGLEPFTIEFKGEEIQTIKANDTEYNVSFTTVVVEGEAPQIEGYNLIAMLERFNGENLVKRFNFNDEELEQKQVSVEQLAYRTTECNHCNSNRARKYIMVLENAETGEIIQVGKACLKDYTNSNYSAEQIASYYEELDVISELEKVDDEFFGGLSSYQMHYDLDSIVALSIEFTDTKGYVSSTSAMSTKQEVCNYLFERQLEGYKDMENIDVLLEKHKDKIQATKEFYASQETKSDYIHNLKTILGAEYIEYKHFGYTVSAYSSYLKAMEKLNTDWESLKAQREEEKAQREKEQAEKLQSKYVGEVGKRETFNLTFTNHLVFDGFYGVSYMYFFKDENSNVFVWTTNKDLELEKGEALEIVGTVKEHKEYRDVKQTIITRCKLK